MNKIDIAILAIMGISCLMGVVRGITKEILGFFTWVGAGAAAYLTYPHVAVFARDYIANPMIADGVTGVVLFILYLIIFSIITFNISNAVRGSAVGGLDRGLGLVYGVVRGYILLCAIEIAFSLFISRETQSETIQSAQFVPIIRRGSDELVALLPTKWRETLDQQTRKLQAMGTQAEKDPGQLLAPITPKEGGEQNKGANGYLSEGSGESSQFSPASGRKEQGSISEGRQGAIPLERHSYSGVSSGARGGDSGRGMMSPAQTSTVSGKSKMSPMDREKAAESLSDLKPSRVDIKGDEGVYDKHQQRELDRLIEASD
jgi:membrane protein required for colicin V production